MPQDIVNRVDKTIEHKRNRPLEKFHSSNDVLSAVEFTTQNIIRDEYTESVGDEAWQLYFKAQKFRRSLSNQSKLTEWTSGNNSYYTCRLEFNKNMKMPNKSVVINHLKTIFELCDPSTAKASIKVKLFGVESFDATIKH